MVTQAHQRRLTSGETRRAAYPYLPIKSSDDKINILETEAMGGRERGKEKGQSFHPLFGAAEVS